MSWRKSSYSSSNGGNCVEVGTTHDAIAVRDSNDPYGPALAFSRASWEAFSGHLRMIHKAEQG